MLRPVRRWTCNGIRHSFEPQANASLKQGGPCGHSPLSVVYGCVKCRRFGLAFRPSCPCRARRHSDQLHSAPRYRENHSGDGGRMGGTERFNTRPAPSNWNDDSPHRASRQVPSGMEGNLPVPAWGLLCLRWQDIDRLRRRATSFATDGPCPMALPDDGAVEQHAGASVCRSCRPGRETGSFGGACVASGPERVLVRSEDTSTGSGHDVSNLAGQDK